MHRGTAHIHWYVYHESCRVSTHVAAHSETNERQSCVFRRVSIQSIYPSLEFEEAYSSSTPLTFVILVSSTFLLMAAVFFFYDAAVQARNRKMVLDSARSNTIVSNMFPGALRDKVLLDQKKREYRRRKAQGATKSTQELENDGDGIEDDYEDSVLAEKYPSCTVIFAE